MSDKYFPTPPTAPSKEIDNNAEAPNRLRKATANAVMSIGLTFGQQREGAEGLELGSRITPDSGQMLRIPEAPAPEPQFYKNRAARRAALRRKI